MLHGLVEHFFYFVISIQTCIFTVQNLKEMIKKSIYTLLLSLSGFSLLNAQSLTGFPWSKSLQGSSLSATEHIYPATDNTANLNKPQPSAYMVATSFKVDLSFPESGSLTKLDNGAYVWRAQLTVAEAQAIGTYFDKFELPARVALFVSNSNGKHIVGPFTSTDNDESGYLPIEAVQGNNVYLELNIEPGVNFDDIKLHVYKLASYFRGVSELEYYSDDYTYGTIDAWDGYSFETSSKCMINAVCPQSAGYETALNATVKEIISYDEGVGYCSGTMVNRIGNSSASCKKYLLTATHCEGSNSTSSSDAVYKEWQNRFYYQSATCTNPSTAPVSYNITGVNFIARDPYDDAASASDLDADFLLLEILKPAPSFVTANAKLAGFDRNPSHTKAYVSPKKFVYFHHPAGDIKKFSSSKNITDASYYWAADFTEGYGAPGSSGSGMFDNDSRVIGIASVATYGACPDSCKYSARNIYEATETSTKVWYAKVSYCWANTSISSPTDKQMLKPWLDPENTGASNSNPATWKCESTAVNEIILPSFNGDFDIYPNPSNDGIFQMNIRLNEPTQAKVEVYDISGRMVFAKDLGTLHSQIVNLNLSSFTNGMYMIKISNTYGQITKKVIINK